MTSNIFRLKIREVFAISEQQQPFKTCKSNSFAKGNKLGGLTDPMRILEDRHHIQNDLEKLKIQSELNRMLFNEGNEKILLITGNNQPHGNKRKNSLLQSSVENTGGKSSG